MGLVSVSGIKPGTRIVVDTDTVPNADPTYYPSSSGVSTHGFGYITGTVYSDQDSATDGFYVEESRDGSNWDYAHPKETIAAGGSLGFDYRLVGKFIRIVWDPEAGPNYPTTFRLYAALRD